MAKMETNNTNPGNSLLQSWTRCLVCLTAAPILFLNYINLLPYLSQPLLVHLPTPTSVQRHEQLTDCDTLMATYGFWRQEQCDLWHLIEQNESIDMSPYQVENIPPSERWWQSTSNNNESVSLPPDNHYYPPGHPLGPIIYHLHFFKFGGTTICNIFTRAHKTRITNPADNCNPPMAWHLSPSKIDYWTTHLKPFDNTTAVYFHRPIGRKFNAYLGDSRAKMKEIYGRVKAKRWRFIANEGSLEPAPIFGSQGPYFYQTMLRDPLKWVVSCWKYETKRKNWAPTSLTDYIRQRYWGKTNFVTRRLCGTNCVLEEPLSEDHFLRAKSMLENFDVVLLLEDFDSYGFALFSKLYPSLNISAPSKDHVKGRRQQYNRSYKFTPDELDLVRNITWMDKVLYEYGWILLSRKLQEYGIPLP